MKIKNSCSPAKNIFCQKKSHFFVANTNPFRYLGRNSKSTSLVKQSVLASTFIQFRERLRRVAAGIVGDGNQAEDVIHDAFCRLWSRHADVTDEVSAIKLSYIAVRNTAIDSLRHQRAFQAFDIDAISEDREIDEGTSAREEQAVYDAVIRISKDALKPSQYEVFRMHDIEGLSYEEVAQAIGVSQEYARVTLSRARKTIRDIYRKRLTEE